MAGKFLRSIGVALSAAFAPAVALAAEGQPSPGEIGMQDSVTPIADSIHTFHNGILLWTAVLISLLVLALLVIIIVRFNARANPTPAKFTHNTLVEVIWTALPVIILVIIAIPSFAVLTDQMTIPDGQRKYLGSNIFSFGSVDVPAPGLTVKVTGQQWFWSYEYVDQQKGFDSYILSEEERLAQNPPQPRLLAVDNRLVIPVGSIAINGVSLTVASVERARVTLSIIPHTHSVTTFNALRPGNRVNVEFDMMGKYVIGWRG